MDELKEKLKLVMAKVFKITPEKIPDNISLGGINEWDSLRHMDLILALEEDFDIRFTDEEINDLISLDLIAMVVALKLKAS